MTEFCDGFLVCTWSVEHPVLQYQSTRRCSLDPALWVDIQGHKYYHWTSRGFIRICFSGGPDRQQTYRDGFKLNTIGTKQGWGDWALPLAKWSCDGAFHAGLLLLL